MHGPAVASLAVGRTIGVAPEADLYYIAAMTGRRGLFGWTYNFHDYAQGVRRVLEINDQLPADRKIRFAEHGDRLLVAMDARTLASHVGTEDYLFSSQGGWNWSIPYLAGAYCLAAQVHPSLTPEKFWSLALQTGRTTRIEHDGKQLPLGPILNPAALINALGTAR